MNTIALIGAGKMGENVARALPCQARRLIIDLVAERAQAVANACHAEASTELDKARSADAIILVVPPRQTLDLVTQLAQLVERQPLLINMATAIHSSELQEIVGDRMNIASVKIIGQSEEMKRGTRACVVVDATEDQVFETCKTILGGLGLVMRGDEEKYQKVNRLAAEEVTRAALAIQQQLMGEHFPEEVIRAAICNVAVGTIRNFPWETPDYFMAGILNRLQESNLTSS